MREFTLFTSNSCQNASNCVYPNELKISTQQEFANAIKYDHVTAKYKNNRRSKDNFLWSDVIALDCDNETDDESRWLVPFDIAIEFPKASFAIVYSRHHNKQKGDKSPRPRFHVFFPIPKTEDADEYVRIKQMIVKRFPYFDTNALDSARFFFGSDAEVEFYEGPESIVDAIDVTDAFEDFDNEQNEIKEGSRNSSMSHIAGKLLKRYGNTDDAYALYIKKSELCNPPLEQEELDAIWNSALKFESKISKQEGYIPPEQYNAGYRLKPDEYSDVGQAIILAKEYKNILRYSPSTDYMVYNGSYWEESKEKAQGLSQELTLKQLEEAKIESDKAVDELSKNGGLKILATVGANKAKTMLKGSQKHSFDKYEQAEEYKKYCIKRQDTKNITATLKEARPMLVIEQREYDKDEFLLNTPSATYDLRKGMDGVLVHDSSNMITKQTSVDPSSVGEDIWKETLDTFFDADEELIEYVQKIVGLAAIGEVYVEALIIAYGEGRNGKSTFWNVISRVLGTYSGNISADMLTAVCKRNVKPELAEAKGKRILIAAELQEGMRLNTSSVKQLCSTDDIYAEKKYKDPFSYTPTHTLVLYTNHLPKVGAIDEGTWRRLIIIPFNAKLEGKNEVKNYADYLFTNAGGAILSWIIEGARKVIKEDYKIAFPSKVSNAIHQYKEDNDWFAFFVNECCEVDESYECKSSELYYEYRMFCNRTSEFVRNNSDFCAALESKGFKRQHTKKGNIIHGIRIKSDFLKE